MDGRFVPNITIGPVVVEAVRKATAKPVDVHLMIVEPERYLRGLSPGPAPTILIVHCEPSSTDPSAPDLGADPRSRKTAGVVLNPATPSVGDRVRARALRGRPDHDRQSRFWRAAIPAGDAAEDPRAAAPVRRARARSGDRGRRRLSGANAWQVRDAGATAIVAGSHIFHAPDYAEAIAAIRQSTAPRRERKPPMSAIAPRIDVSPDPEALAHRVAQWIADLACHNSGRLRGVCLSGGSTPRRLYQLLAAPPLRDVMPWQRIHWFWGDERFVPWDHPDSNYGMARAGDAGPRPGPTRQHPRHRICRHASRCGARLSAMRCNRITEPSGLDPARPLFDVVLLGMGPDGHTASLIPGEPVLDEKARWVAEVTHGRPEARITLTYPALDSSRSIGFCRRRWR